jgi:hypothetical protein
MRIDQFEIKGFKMKQMVLFLVAVFFLVGCETGTKYKKNETTPTIDSSTEERQVEESSIIDLIDGQEPVEEKYFNEDEVSYISQQFEGGVVSDGLNIKSIREGRHSNYERLVFDVQSASVDGQMEGKKVNEVGYYSATYDPNQKLISVVINGYKNFTASFPHFSRESIIEKMYFEGYRDDSAYKFYIKLKKNTEVKIFDLKSPARMVFDIKSI